MDNPFATIMATLQSAWINNKASDEELNNERTMLARALVESRKTNPNRIDSLLYIIKTFMYIENSDHHALPISA